MTIERNDGLKFLGWRVVQPGKDGKLIPLSRFFGVQAAAEEFAGLAKKAGHPDAYVESKTTKCRKLKGMVIV